jgi:hypothetical protein
MGANLFTFVPFVICSFGNGKTTTLPLPRDVRICQHDTIYVDKAGLKTPNPNLM